MTQPADDANKSDFVKSRRFLGLPIDRQSVIKAFFGANAAATIVVLALIMIFLGKEAAGFLPSHRWELAVYRKAGLEFCDYVQKPIKEQSALNSKIKRALAAELNTLTQSARERRDAALLLKERVEDRTSNATDELADAIKDKAPPEKIAALHRAVSDAAAKVLGEETMPSLFSEAEKSRLKAELTAMQPDQDDLPPLIQSLIRDFTTRDAEAKQKYAVFATASAAFEQAAEPLVKAHGEIKQLALATKEAAVRLRDLEDQRAKLLEAAQGAKTAEQRESFQKQADAVQLDAVDFKARTQPLLDRLPEFEKLMPAYLAAVEKAAGEIPDTAETKAARHLLKQARAELPSHVKHTAQCLDLMKQWDAEKPVPMTQVLTSFLFGGDWITNSSWQDFYGVLPLLSGSACIALVALLIATPLSVAAAIYTNRFASRREQNIIKPGIEFIQAIPSVVFGFIGIAVLGDLIKHLSQISWLSWVPGFPVQERLNMFNAGCLLALMAIPTMFSLAEDAINNVPRAFNEASEAMGATKVQTVFRVIVPSAFSGILAAMLLGLGRIIGETMVVLLVAGNRIAIPDFSDGIGVVFQPAHTLTGIIAQELGEVSPQSTHWQALFMVGVLLFAISLLINWLARTAARRFAIPRN